MGKAARVCGHSGCPEIVLGANYCEDHTPKPWTGSTWKRPQNWDRLRQQVMRRDRKTCVYCGDPATEVDHIIPQSRGGKDTLDNLAAACTACNQGKNIAQRSRR